MSGLDLDVAEKALSLATGIGAQEAKVSISRASHVELDQREKRLEKSSESVTQGLTLTLMVDDRFSAHSTSDLRPEAIEGFVRRAVDATRVLEPDPDYRQLPFESMGKIPLEELELFDPSGLRNPGERGEIVSGLEEELDAGKPDNLISATSYLWESQTDSSVVFSNGFSGKSKSTQYGLGAEVTLSEEGGKRPEASAFYSARHLSDLPPVEHVASEVWSRANESFGGSAAPTGRYTLLLANRSVGRILGAVLGPLSGAAIWQGRSVFADKLGKEIGSSSLSILDDPQIPRAHGSRSFDKDGLRPKPRTIVKDGVLKTWLLDAYHARKLSREPNGGGLCNVLVRPGERNWRDILKSHDQAIRVTSFLGGNSNPTSGDFSFGIRGQLFKNGECVQNVSEMNVAGNILDLLQSYEEAADDPWNYSSYRVPSLIFRDVQFSGN
jgi:PmbA protein